MSCALAAVSVAGAQEVVLRSPGPGTLSGLVVDTLGNPLQDADVLVQQLQQRTRTGPDGTFLFKDVRPGRYDVGARKLGFVASTQRVTVGDNGGTVMIRMLQIGVVLPSMVTKAELGGLSGVIGDTSYLALAGVRVSIIGKEQEAITDSTGAFFIPLRPGRYMVELTQKGYARQLVGVSIPDNEGRKIAAWMVPSPEGDNPRIGANLFEMSQRIMRANPVWTKFFTREDMEKLGITEIRQVASMQAMRLMNPDCPVVIDGGPRTLPLWQIAAADVEFVEVYTTKAATPKTTSINGNPTNLTASTSMTPTSDCGTALIVWLRK